eukprot:PLAT10777.1.p1 GENE.PLAT10777.1~~PLAT10777.1.p1  ORF type:complete len:279 (+),score=132.21 PLAT10777.1:38-838(+)
MLALLGVLLRQLRILLAGIWLHVNNRMSRRKLRDCSVGTHKVLIVGDGFAAGMGDRWSPGETSGAAVHAERAINALPAVKARWYVLNRGYFGSTAQDWSPVHESRPAYFGWASSQPLWKEVMLQADTVQAEVVVFMVGSMDVRWSQHGSAEAALAALRAAAEVVTSSRYCCVCMVPSLDSTYTRQLRAGVRALVASSADWKRPLLMGPDVGAPALRTPSMLAFDGLHLNHAGYRKLGTQLASSLRDTLLRVEWEAFKKAEQEEAAR